MSNVNTESVTFSDLNLSQPILKTLNNIGYEVPSPIQSQTIPHLLKGKDVLGQAQTGTGKTAAFALPMISNIDLKKKKTQVLVLAPTRELAIQVSEAFEKYSAEIKGLKVLAVYGGQNYREQTSALKGNVHVVVGTPGRIMDHMRRGNLDLAELDCLVLDEADEMLRMGFIEDVEWILEQTPENRQIALFSATMPKEIQKIAQRYLTNSVEVKIKTKTATNNNISQKYWKVDKVNKLDALRRILEAESFDGSIIFTRTKTATTDLADKLNQSGFKAAALNGDILQRQREQIVQKLKDGKIDIIVATDVAARGLDVERISLVINYDIPGNSETYVHRIGRTGRAGRTGRTILFVSNKEKHLLKIIERETKQKIEEMPLPSIEEINKRRVEEFKELITSNLAAEGKDYQFFLKLLKEYLAENPNLSVMKVAAVLGKLYQGKTQFLLSETIKLSQEKRRDPNERERKRKERDDKAMRRKRGSYNKDKERGAPKRRRAPSKEGSSRDGSNRRRRK